MEHKRHQRLAKCQYLTKHTIYIFTFGFARSSERVVRAVIDMEYIASDKLGDLVRLRVVREVHFTYAVRLVQHVSILLNMFNVPSMM